MARKRSKAQKARTEQPMASRRARTEGMTGSSSVARSQDAANMSAEREARPARTRTSGKLVFDAAFHPYGKVADAAPVESTDLVFDAVFKPLQEAEARDAGAQGARRPQKRRRRGRIAAIVAASMCCVLLCGVGAVALALTMGKSNLVQEAQVEVEQSAVSEDNGKTVTYNGVTYRQKEHMTSLLLLGHDGRTTDELNGQTDFVMLLAVDTESGQMDLISIPRDTMVQVRMTYSNTDEYAELRDLQVAAAFAYGSDLNTSALNVCDAVSRMLYNVPINYYYVLNVQGIGPLADAVGGVTVEALMDVKPANIVAGKTYTLKGQQASYYVQYRDIKQYGSAFGRLDRQKQFLKAYAAKALEEAKGNPAVILNIIDSVSAYSTTNIGMAEMSFLAQVFLEHGMADLDMTTLEGDYTHNDETGYAEYHLNREAVYQTFLNIYYEPLPDDETAQHADEERSDADAPEDAEE